MRFLLLLALSLAVSCANGPRNSSQGRSNSETELERKDLIEAFHLENEEFKKFKEQPLAEKVRPAEEETKVKAPASVVTKDVTKEKAKVKVKEQRKTKGEKAPSQKQVLQQRPVKAERTEKEEKEKKEEQEEQEVVEAREEKAVLSYPADFPENLKEYDRQSAKVWEKFSPIFIPGEVLKFKVKYFGVVCGQITLRTLEPKRIGDKKAFHLKAHLQSASFYEYFYTLDDSIEAFVEEKNFLPLKYVLIQRESKQNVDDLQLFDREKFKTFFWMERTKKGETKKFEEAAYIPYYVQDSYSVLFFVRGLPLQVGDQYEFPIITRAKMWVLKAKVDRKEVIQINGKDVESILVKAETHYPGVLKKKGDILFWYSADSQKKLLKFSAKVKIGSIEGELTEEDLVD